MSETSHIEPIDLHETAQARYLNYAMSVITSRALPDVRDGMKPVQRRILYAMYNDLRLTSEAKHRKSAAVVGGVMAVYHPHGDQSIYDAMVRQAQDFSMRYTLVDGQGNFGSLDGDGAAAMRYTEARLTAIAGDLMGEIRKQTVEFRPNYDGTAFEPVVLPAQAPALLMNGATGIAVGMATNVPPHHLPELVDALIALSKNPELSLQALVERHIKGPDFPTGGVLVEDQASIQETYAKGSGTFTIRADWEQEKIQGKRCIIVTSIPYTINRSTVVEKIATHIIQGKLPMVDDVRDESAEDVRIVLELKRNANVEATMAYLFKHTPLQHRFHVNLTCLVPTDNPLISAPARLNLKQMLQHFLTFRMEVVQRRTRFDLEQLRRRIHLLEGLEIIFDALDEAIAIIRASDGKKDASARLMERFGLDEQQTDAVLEKRLYTLAKLEIDAIRKELADKRTQAQGLVELLEDEGARWKLIRKELRALKRTYGDERRTRVDVAVREFEYSEENYIVDEHVYVILTRDGWLKRQKSYSDLSTIRVRDNDEIRHVLPGNTRGTVMFFSNQGRVYTMRVDDVTSTSGYGDPLQASFDFDDGETIVGMLTSFDPLQDSLAALPEDDVQLALLGEDAPEPLDQPREVNIVAIAESGMGIRTSIEGFVEPSNVKGRQYIKLSAKDTVVNVEPCRGDEILCIASRDSRGLTFMAREISKFKGSAKGVKTMGLDKKDSILDFTLTTDKYAGLEVETNRGAREVIRASIKQFALSSRGNKGRLITQRGHLIRSHKPPVEIRFEAFGDEASEE